MPLLTLETELGSIYEVKKVGFVLVDKSDCEIKKINTLNALEGKCALPTAVMLFDGQYELCSLPVALSEWVQECVYMAFTGMNMFPAKVEFGVLNNRVYAKIK
jgi:hypothetical protein